MRELISNIGGKKDEFNIFDNGPKASNNSLIFTNSQINNIANLPIIPSNLPTSQGMGSANKESNLQHVDSNIYNFKGSESMFLLNPQL